MMNMHVYPFKAMGTHCTISISSESEALARQIADKAIAECRRLESKYTRYSLDSLTSRINASAGLNPVEIDEETFQICEFAQTAYDLSEGYFDITSGILRKIWYKGRKDFPEESEIDKVLKLIGWEYVQYDTDQLFLSQKGMEIDFGGLVKEYVADSLATLCEAEGVASGMVNLGGDVRTVGQAPTDDPWKVAVSSPSDMQHVLAWMPITTGAIATSGDYERKITINGQDYSHILNPKTGLPVKSFKSVSVYAQQCIIAGAASTIAMIKGVEQGKAWLDKLGLPYVCLDHNNKVDGTITIKR